MDILADLTKRICVGMTRELSLKEKYHDVLGKTSDPSVAQRLMDAAKHFAQETNSKGLSLETDLDNIAAQKLYDGLGYERQDDTYHYFLGNEKSK